MRSRYLLAAVALSVAGAFAVPALRAVAQSTVDIVYACTNTSGIVTQLRVDTPPSCNNGEIMAWEVGGGAPPPPSPGGAAYRVVDGAGVDLGAFVGSSGGDVLVVERSDGVMIGYLGRSGKLFGGPLRGVHYNTPDCSGTPLLEAIELDGGALIPEEYTSYNLVVTIPLEPTAGSGNDIELTVAQIAAEPVPGEPNGSVLLTEDFSCLPVNNTGFMFELVELTEQPGVAVPGLRVVPST